MSLGQRDREALRQGQIGRESRAHGMKVVSNKLVEQEEGGTEAAVRPGGGAQLVEP